MRIARLLVLMAAAAFAIPALAADDVSLFKLIARDGKFEPAVLEVPAGKRFRLEVTNENRKAIEFESKDLKQEKIVPPGGKVVVNVSALKPGEYAYFDEFEQQTSRGKIVAK